MVLLLVSMLPPLPPGGTTALEIAGPVLVAGAGAGVAAGAGSGVGLQLTCMWFERQ